MKEIKAFFKKALFGTGRSGRRIPFGLYRGLILSIDPACEMSLWLGTYEAETSSWLRWAGKEAQSLIDLGAGYGELTVWGLKQRRMKCVLAYDPKPERWPVFRENLALNYLTNDARLEAREDWFLGGDAPDAAMQLFAELPEPILMKMDIDGGEEIVLKKLRDVLRQKQVFCLIETHSKELDEACHSLLKDAGHEVKRLAPAWWRKLINEQRPIGFNQWLVATP